MLDEVIVEEWRVRRKIEAMVWASKFREMAQGINPQDAPLIYKQDDTAMPPQEGEPLAEEGEESDGI